MAKVLTFILAGGKGERLDPLTKDRTKPAVPFAGIYRIIDFTLSNCVNSDLRRIYVLIQYKSFSLQKHILAGWDIFSTQLGEFIDVIPSQQRIGSDWYRGTADAIFQNSYTIEDHDPDLVLILAGDHIYKMDYRQMIQHHVDTKADMTVACVPTPKEEAEHFGVIEVDKKGQITGFQEKPSDPKTIPGDDSKIFSSMGIYLFKKDVLLEELEKDAQNIESRRDFGQNVIPQMIQAKRKLCVYNFVDEKDTPKYWRDIGTRDAYYQANLDLVRPKPEFDLYDKSWPVRTYHSQYPPIKMTSGAQDSGVVEDSLISGGCVIDGGVVKGSVLSSNVRIGDKALVENAVIMESVIVGKNTKIKNAIIDKEVAVPDNETIGYDLELDKKRFAVTASGIVIVGKKAEVKGKDLKA